MSATSMQSVLNYVQVDMEALDTELFQVSY